MSNEKKTYVCRRMRVLSHLLQHGFEPFAVSTDFKNPKYKEYEAFKFVEHYMNKIKEDGVVWGYDLQYLMTGLMNQHPRTAISFTKENRKDYAEFYKELIQLD